MKETIELGSDTSSSGPDSSVSRRHYASRGPQQQLHTGNSTKPKPQKVTTNKSEPFPPRMRAKEEYWRLIEYWNRFEILSKDECEEKGILDHSDVLSFAPEKHILSLSERSSLKFKWGAWLMFGDIPLFVYVRASTDTFEWLSALEFVRAEGKRKAAKFVGSWMKEDPKSECWKPHAEAGRRCRLIVGPYDAALTRQNLSSPRMLAKHESWVLVEYRNKFRILSYEECVKKGICDPGNLPSFDPETHYDTLQKSCRTSWGAILQVENCQIWIYRRKNADSIEWVSREGFLQFMESQRGSRFYEMWSRKEAIIPEKQIIRPKKAESKYARMLAKEGDLVLVAYQDRLKLLSATQCAEEGIVDCKNLPSFAPEEHKLKLISHKDGGFEWGAVLEYKLLKCGMERLYLYQLKGESSFEWLDVSTFHDVMSFQQYDDFAHKWWAREAIKPRCLILSEKKAIERNGPGINVEPITTENATHGNDMDRKVLENLQLALNFLGMLSSACRKPARDMLDKARDGIQ